MTFEANNIIGRRVRYDDLNLKEGLVQVIGDYYRYQLVDGSNPQPGHTYVIVQAHGNVLELAPQGEEG
ncbi:hypothetical protein PUF88_01685 [Lactobacillaceae bacterium L1_55_11]|nr:hypothetical protein [Lactobacillaceae bacterium L1_55_11]